MLVVLDLETTGLDPMVEEILEVAAVIVDDNLAEIASRSWLVYPRRAFWEIGEYVRDMHTKNGLLGELRGCESSTSTWIEHNATARVVDHRLAAFIREHAVKLGKTVKDGKEVVTIDRPQLCGNTISFDRAFLKRHMPEAHAELHYRNLDVSTLNEAARRFWPAVYAAAKQSKPDPAAGGVEHRAMYDARCSLEQLRAYTKLLGPIVPVEGSSAPDGTLPVPQ